MKTRPHLVFVFLGLLCCSCHTSAGSAQAAGNTLPPNLQGAWQQGSQVIRIEPERIVEFDGQGLVVRGLVGRAGDRLTLRRGGLKEDWRASVQGSALRLEHAGSATVYHRLDQVPPQVDLSPLPVAPSHQLPASRVDDIQKEIAERFESEQVQLKDPTRGEDRSTLRRSNLGYLRGLLADVGWIDSDRFGQRTSVYTVLLAKHTEDLRLMLTVLPHASEELKKSGKGQTYAILYDAVQLDLGHKQRYGTQVTEDAKGPYVLPLEDPQHVDNYLADLGLPPLQIYLAQVRTHLYNGRPVRLLDDN